MTLKQLEAFHWAATCASFALAAERLHLSVSTLSKRIAELEASLGQELFDRDAYRARLTPAGETLLPRVSTLLAQAEGLRLAAKGDHDMRGLLRMGVGELASLTWLPRFIATASARYPRLQLAPHVEVGVVMERMLENGELDFTVAAGASGRRRLLSYPIGQAEFLWAANPALAERKVSPAQLQALTLVTMPIGAGTHRMMEEWLARAGAVRGPLLTCNTWGSVAALMAEGLGVGFLPRAWALPMVSRGLLRLLPDWPALTPLHYSLQIRQDDQRPIVHGMKALLEEVVDFGLPISLLATSYDAARRMAGPAGE